MVPGIPNPYIAIPLNKMWLYEIASDAVSNNIGFLSLPHPVLYNPQTVKISRVTVPEEEKKDAIKNGMQIKGLKFNMIETLDVDLFLDGFSAGAEVTDLVAGKLRGLKYAANSVLPSATKWAVSIQDEIDWILQHSTVDSSTHTVKALGLKWGNIIFGGVVSACNVQYLKFNEMGKAMRASVHLSILGRNEINYPDKYKFFFSPDTSKYHTVQQNETLNDISRIAYDGDPTQWRRIAEANDIVNPRILRTGSVVHMPAIVD